MSETESESGTGDRLQWATTQLEGLVRRHEEHVQELHTRFSTRAASVEEYNDGRVGAWAEYEAAVGRLVRELGLDEVQEAQVREEAERLVPRPTPEGKPVRTSNGT
ncbi:hypothetical protein [Kineococcus gypseus]|uniref:hypothetical protein n=1 Tax=Kineococcus gypseus TaxID=1637102 RepID=UPI003D7DA223